VEKYMNQIYSLVNSGKRTARRSGFFMRYFAREII